MIPGNTQPGWWHPTARSFLIEFFHPRRHTASVSRRAILALIIVGLLAAAGVAYGVVATGKPGALDGFAQCLTAKKVVFYGAFWCSHCQNQKRLFGKSARYLSYVECSTPDGRGQLPACTDKKIDGYPTWEFADGSRQGGEVPLSTLAEKSGCTLPSGAR